jgi:hypothetical protein
MISIRAENSERNLFDGRLASITQPIIFEANVACRLLLDFLDLCTAGATPPMLRPIRQRRRTDIGIEHYRKRDGSPLEKLDLLKLSERYGDNVLSSWASVIAIVNKRLSHLTDDSSARGVEADKAIATTFAAVPDLVRQEFLEKLYSSFSPNYRVRPMEIARISGHRALSVLALKRYTHLRAEDLVGRLG